jgi:hypothetical protein
MRERLGGGESSSQWEFGNQLPFVVLASEHQSTIIMAPLHSANLNSALGKCPNGMAFKVAGTFRCDLLIRDAAFAGALYIFDVLEKSSACRF